MPNLTRDEARGARRAARRRRLRGRARPDRRRRRARRATRSARRPRSASPRPRAGRGDLRRSWSPTVREVTLNGRALDPAAYRRGRGIALPDLAADNVLASSPTARTRTPARACTGSSTRSTARSTSTRSSRPPTPADVRLLRPARPQGARSRFTVTAPADWEVVSNAADAEAGTAGDGRRRRHVRDHPRISHVHHRARRRARTTWCATRSRTARRGHPARASTAAPSLAEHLDADDDLRGHQAGLRLLRGDVRLPRTRSASTTSSSCPSSTPARWRTRAASRSTRTTSSARKVTDAAYERRADTILHEMAHMWFGDLVTMRWWDDLWLNESFAELHVACSRRREATRFTDGLDDVRQRSRRPGPTGRTSCPRRTRSPPTSPTSRPSRSTSTASRTPRAPRCSSSSSPRSGDRAVPGRACGATSAARVGQHHAGRPARRAGGDLRPRPVAAGRRQWLRDRRASTRCARRSSSTPTGRFTSFAVVQEAGRPSQPDAAHRTGSRSACTTATGRGQAWCAPRGSSWTSPAPAPRCPSWSASPSRTCCWSTTTT